MSEWIEDFKSTHTATAVARALGGYTVTGKGGITPCPACGAAKRSRSDKRAPVGSNGKGDAWKCFVCAIEGDVVEFACRALHNTGNSEMNGPQWRSLHASLVERGLSQESAGGGGRGSRAKSNSARDGLAKALASAGVGSPRKRAPKPTATPTSAARRKGMYAWHPKIPVMAHEALGGDTPEAATARAYLHDVRKISAGTVGAYGIGLYVNAAGVPYTKSGRPIITIPLRNDDGVVVNVKFRSVPVPGTCQHCNGTAGCKKCRDYRNCEGMPLPLFGCHTLSSDLSCPVLTVEGEFDVLAMHTYGFTENVVGTTGGAETFHDEWLDLLEPYEHIVGVYDDDEVGEGGWVKAAEKLGIYRCSRATLPMNDANACLMAELPSDQIDRAIARAKPMHGIEMRKVNNWTDVIETMVEDPESLRGVQCSSSLINRALAGIRPGVIVIGAETNQGKTTVATWLCLDLARMGHGVMITSFEQGQTGTVQKLLRNQVGGDFTAVDKSIRVAAMQELAELDLWILDHYGQIKPTKLFETIAYAKRRNGVRFFLIDHLGFAIDPDERDERLAIQSFMRTLAIVAHQLQITVFLVAHVTGGEDVGKGRKPGRPTMRKLKGASAIRQDADDIIMIERIDPSKEVPWPRSKWHFDKVRSDFGNPGSSVTLAFDPLSCVFADSWDDTPAGKRGMIVPRTE